MPRLRHPSPLRVLRHHWKLVLAAVIFCYACYCFWKLYRSLKAPSTESVLMALAAAAAAWEAYTLADKTRGNTFSAVIFKLARVQTQIPFLYGQLGKHLFGGDPLTLQAFEAGIAAGEWWPLKDKEDLQEAKNA